jgi:hypothetical protein
MSVETDLHSPIYKVGKALEDVLLALGTFVYIERAFDDITFEAIRREPRSVI